MSKFDHFCVEILYVEGWTHQSGQGQRWAVGLAHKEPSKNDLVEGSIRATSQESVQLQHRMANITHFYENYEQTAFL